MPLQAPTKAGSCSGIVGGGGAAIRGGEGSGAAGSGKGLGLGGDTKGDTCPPDGRGGTTWGRRGSSFGVGISGGRVCCFGIGCADFSAIGALTKVSEDQTT